MEKLLQEEETEEKIVNGTHNYSTEEAYVRPTDPPFTRSRHLRISCDSD